MAVDLKPCPFCGRHSAVLLRSGDVSCDYTLCMVSVTAIGIENWNDRPIEDALRSDLAAAMAEITELNEIIKNQWRELVEHRASIKCKEETVHGREFSPDAEIYREKHNIPRDYRP